MTRGKSAGRGAAEFVGDAGTDERGHGIIECLAQLDGLEVLGLVVEAGQAQGGEDVE